MSKNKPFTEALLAFIQANPGVIFTLTPEQLAEQIGTSLGEARAYYQGIAQEKRRLAQQAEEARIHEAEAEIITYIPSSQKVHVLYYPQLGEVKMMSTYQRKRKYPQEEKGWRQDREPDAVLLSPQDSIDIGIYLSGLQPHIRDTQTRLAAEPEPPEPKVPETYIPFVAPPDRMKLSNFARRHGISATHAVKYFDRHEIAGEREPGPYGGKTVDGVVIYSQGQCDAWQQLHELPGFQSCPQCPHELEDDDGGTSEQSPLSEGDV